MSGELDLLYSGVEDELRHTVRDLLADRCDATAVTAVYDGDRTVVAPLWKTLASDLGLAGLLVPEDLGGAAATAREAAVVLEELGRAAAPVPFLTSSVVATTVLHGTDDELVPALASGETTAALAMPLAAGPGAPLQGVEVSGARLTGAITSVAGALEADVLLVPAAAADHLALYAVAAGEVSISPVVSLDMTRQLADLRLESAHGRLLLAEAEPAIRAGLEAGAALLASEQLGIARWCMEETLAYLKGRRQFGRVVGGFQAIKHRLADLYLGLESAAAAARYAAATLAVRDDDAAVAASVAQAYVSDLTVLAAEEAVQLHGGMGMTWEHPAHLYLKKAKADQIAFGIAGAHRAKLASLIDLPGTRETMPARDPRSELLAPEFSDL